MDSGAGWLDNRQGAARRPEPLAPTESRAGLPMYDPRPKAHPGRTLARDRLLPVPLGEGKVISKSYKRSNSAAGPRGHPRTHRSPFCDDVCCRGLHLDSCRRHVLRSGKWRRRHSRPAWAGSWH